MTIVLVTRGKHESVDYAKVLLFNNYFEAKNYCEDNSLPGKYWTKAEIVKENTEIELDNHFE